MAAGTLRTTRLARWTRMDRTSLLAARFGMWVGGPVGLHSWLEQGPGWLALAVCFVSLAASGVQGLALAALPAACCGLLWDFLLPRGRPPVVGPLDGANHPAGPGWLP